MEVFAKNRVPKLCLVVPCYNEEQALPALFETAIPELDRATGGNWSLLCVDDGSCDATFELIARRNGIDSRVTGIRLSRNFGHQAAVSTGMAFAEGEYIGVIDADLQDPIEVLIQLYEKARRENIDVCFGIRGRRESTLFLRMAYSAFYRIIDRLADHDWPRDAGDFCVLSARCHQVLISLPEHSRMMRGLRAWVGFKQAGVKYARPARMHGETKYSLRRLCALAMQGFVTSSSIPLRAASVIGIGMALVSILFGMAILLNRLVPGFTLLGYSVSHNPGLATVLVFGAFVASMMFLCLGIIGEYLIVMFQELKRRPTAVVDSLVGELNRSGYAGNVNSVGAATGSRVANVEKVRYAKV